MLEGFPLLASLAQEQREKLEVMAQEICLKKGTMLFAPGEQTQGLYIVREGAVRVYRLSSQGKEITQEIAGRGSAFALASLYADTYHCFAAALKDSRLYLIKKKEFVGLVTTDIKFAGEWIRTLSLLVIRLRQRLADLYLKAPKARVAGYLLLLAEMQDSHTIALPVSRKELATLLGMTQETFYRTTKELVNDGLVRFTGQSVDLLDQDRLVKIME
ncbi:MAG: Crp/Fnr family transcriptional regulator [Desulfobaccales bacterium]